MTENVAPTIEAAYTGSNLVREDQPLVVAIILNTNRRDDTLACLESLVESTYSRMQIIVLDNASTDGSVDAINDSFPEVGVLHLTENKGYAGNNNVGIEAALRQGADWIFVLNEDTLFSPDCVKLLVEAGEANLNAGFVGPLVLHGDEPNMIQSAGGSLGDDWAAVHIGENEYDAQQYSGIREVDWIHGCGILARSAMIEEIGVLDERFFYYWEETEWCLRARRSGWTCLHVPAAKMWHKGVQRDYRPNPNVTYYNTRNRLMMMAKHGAQSKAWARVWGGLLRTYASWTLRPRWRAEKRGHPAALRAGATDFLLRRYGKRPT